jgi:hypothetical protein
MAEFKMDAALTKAVLTKRAQSIPLTDVEESYARKLFDYMMTSKKSVMKTVRVVTGADLRKEQGDDLRKMKAEPTREYDFPAMGKQTPKEDPNAQPDTSARGDEKLPDVDGKPKELTTEGQRLADALQHPVTETADEKQRVNRPVSPEPQAKFVSADPVKMGDVVTKNLARTGQMIVKGVVLTVDSSNRATVKWANGMQTYEWAHTLVKAHAAADAPKNADSKLDDMKEGEKSPPTMKGDITHTEAYERVKDKPGVEDPHALAQHIVEQAGGEKSKKSVQKNGDIAPDAPTALEPPVYCTPFQELVCSLERLVGLAAEMKAAQGRIEDPEVIEYYDQLIEHLREMAETILAALSMELTEAQEAAE